MSWTKDNGKFAKDAAEQALLQANYLDEKKPLIDKFTDEQTNLQAQINQLVAEGDSSPEAAQARVGVDDTTYDTLKARLDAENEQVTQQLAQIKPKPYNYIDFGMAFDSSDTNLVVHDNHASWAHANVAYDAEDDVVLVFYDVKPSHVLENNRVLMRKKYAHGGFSLPFVVADKTAQSISCKTQASGIAKNGDYVSLVYEFSGANSGLNVYRSTDKGLSWTSRRVLINGNPITAFNGDVTGFLVLKNGRILTLIKVGTDYSYIMYSDNHGETWQYSATELNGATEPAWVELSDGTIVAYLRANVNNDYSNKIPAKFMVSTNGGANWTTPIDSTSILDFTNSNGHLIYHEDTKTVEFIHHSRYEQSDGYSSLYVSVAKEEDIKNDRMGEQIRISRLSPAYKAVFNSLGDSGYVGAAKDKYGTIHAFYYNGTHASAQICHLEGRKSPININITKFDQRTGKPILEMSKQDISTVVFSTLFEVGGVTGAIGSVDANVQVTNRLRPKKYLIVEPDAKYIFNVAVGYEFVIRLYDINSIILYDSSWRSDFMVATTSDTAYAKILLRKADNSDITLDDVLPATITSKKLVGEEVKLYDHGVEKTFYTGVFNEKLVSNATLTKNTNNLELAIASTASSANMLFVANEGIDVARFSRLKCAVEVTGIEGNVNASLRIYDKNNPTVGDDGRQGLATISTNGKHILEININGLRGLYYPAIAVTKANNTGAINAKFYEIWYE